MDHWEREPTPTSSAATLQLPLPSLLPGILINKLSSTYLLFCLTSFLENPPSAVGNLIPSANCPPDLSVPILSSRPLSPYIVHQTSQSLYCHPHLSVPILSSDLSVPICIILQTSQSLYCVPDLSVPTLSSRPLSHYIVLQTAQTLQYIVLLPFI